jgi:hypothetical protein
MMIAISSNNCYRFKNKLQSGLRIVDDVPAVMTIPSEVQRQVCLEPHATPTRVRSPSSSSRSTCLGTSTLSVDPVASLCEEISQRQVSAVEYQPVQQTLSMPIECSESGSSVNVLAC